MVCASHHRSMINGLKSVVLLNKENHIILDLNFSLRRLAFQSVKCNYDWLQNKMCLLLINEIGIK